MVTSKQQQTYEAIMQLYDLAEELVHIVEEDAVNEEEEGQLILIEPLVEQLAESAAILVEEYAALAKKGEPLDAERKRKMELALGKVFNVVAECRKHNKGE